MKHLGPTPEGWEDGGICHVCAAACHCGQSAAEHPCGCLEVAKLALEVARSVDNTIDLEKTYDLIDPTPREDRITARFLDYYSNHLEDK